MTHNEEQKNIVIEKYGAIASSAGQEEGTIGCCGSSGGCNDRIAPLTDAYNSLAGYVPEADLGLGCGLPTTEAAIKDGDTVVDLGSGAGNDAFVARSLVGERGRVIGVDMTAKMIEVARRNAALRSVTNVEFQLGDIENLPLSDNVADVVVSNCVLNLVPDKKKAFSEIHRILKPGGHFSVSDIVLMGDVSEEYVKRAEAYVGCVVGAMQKSEYLDIARQLGFVNIQVKSERQISIPESAESADSYAQDCCQPNKGKILSISLYGEKLPL